MPADHGKESLRNAERRFQEGSRPQNQKDPDTGRRASEQNRLKDEENLRR